MSKSIVFFAVNEDLKTAAAAIEAEQRLQYVLTGLFDKPELFTANSVELSSHSESRRKVIKHRSGVTSSRLRPSGSISVKCRSGVAE
ncbi:MAG: hypothetical protein JO197_15390 [Acidobacteria bacterium]|nr:hypothetical protein [Acidobacteriota bacterium]MBV9475093.1 hypothetical protein [Acidobacteriota bacterium]